MCRRKSNISVLLAALTTCKKARDFEGAKKIHADAIQNGDDSNIYVANTLIDTYAKCGCILSARWVFDCMPHHDAVSWTSIIMGYAMNGENELALQLFQCMQTGNCVPDARTFVAAVMACSSLALEEAGKQIDGNVVKVGCLLKGKAIHFQATQSKSSLDIFVSNTLIHMYANCGSMVVARGVYDRMPHYDMVSWNALLMGYVENGESELALQTFSDMFCKGAAPNARTFVAAAMACGKLALKEESKPVNGKSVKVRSLETCMAIHFECARCGYESDIFVANTLIDIYSKCGSMANAHRVFDRIPNRNVVSWTALLSGYVVNGEGHVSLQLFLCMQHSGCAPNDLTIVAALKACTTLAGQECGREVDGVLMKIKCLQKAAAIRAIATECGYDSKILMANILVDMYAKCGSMVDARQVFYSMPRRDVVSWTSMILGYARIGEGDLSLQLFAQMRAECCAPNALTYVAILMACGSVAALEAGKTIHREIQKHDLESDPIIANSLIDFYGKCGSMVEAQSVFDSIHKKDFVHWSALISGYSHQGDTEQVFNLFWRIREKGLKVDGITFLSVLGACSHAGLVEKGKQFFELMTSKFGITPGIEHYRCMIDLFGRANQVDDAVAMAKSMPFKPDVWTWTTILSSCWKWKNVEVGRHAFDSLLKIDSQQAAAYVLMGSIYGNAGMWEDKLKVMIMRRDANISKTPGQSWWTDQNGLVHRFVAGDTSHLQTAAIYEKLKHVSEKMKEQGYVADVGCVVHDISEQEKECALNWHSEKLAITCALINTAPGTTIRIIKNLRICDDCHKAISVIARIEQRSIICRDASRFHVFNDGNCSCGNFW